MTPENIIDLARTAMFLTLLLSAPIVITAAVIGLIVGFLQAVTSIQDQSIGIAIKLLVIGLLLVVLSNWIGSEIAVYADRVFSQISHI